MEKTVRNRNSIRRRHDWSSTAPVAAIVDAISELEGVQPTELDFTLFDYVDPDALDALVRGQENGILELGFDVESYRVSIHGESLSVESTD